MITYQLSIAFDMVLFGHSYYIFYYYEVSSSHIIFSVKYAVHHMKDKYIE